VQKASIMKIKLRIEDALALSLWEDIPYIMTIGYY
jgi:hypothetical protein